jgi:signal transduction histidine kinase/DNA-binding response OmpR family regulator
MTREQQNLPIGSSVKPYLRGALVLFLVTILTVFAKAQYPRPNVDSLRRVVDTATVLDIKSNALGKIGLALAKSKRDTTMLIANQLLQLAEEHRGNRRCLYLGTNLLATCAMYSGDYSKGLDLYERAAQLGEHALTKAELAANYHNKANAYFYLNRFSESLESDIQALPLYVELKDSIGLSACYNSRGLTLSNLSRFDEAIYYLRKSLEINLLTGQNAYYTYSRLGEVYGKMENKLDSCILFHQKALEAATKGGKQLGIAISKNNIAEQIGKKGDYAQAKTLFEESLAFFESKKEKHFTPIILCNFADLELNKGHPEVALQLSQKAYALTDGLKNHQVLSTIYDTQAKAYAALHNFPEAYRLARLYQVFKDSVITTERSAEVAANEARFRTAESKKTIQDQSLQLERQQNRNYLLLAIALGVLLAGAALAFFLREKRRRAEIQLRFEKSEADRLRELDSVKSVFFANISHEFRTPLTLLLGPLQEMESGTFKGDFKKYYGIMRRNASRLLTLVNQLLDLSRLESGKLKIHLTPTDLYKVFRVAAGNFESMAEQKQIEYTIQVPEGEYWATTDADHLEKIVSNLLSNAFKFTHEEGRVNFKVESLSTSPAVNIIVSDSGIGINKDQLPFVFDRFYRVENSGADIQEGSGIGLALTKELVQLLGGDIFVESTEKEGTTFKVTLTLEKAEALGSTVLNAISSNHQSPTVRTEAVAMPISRIKSEGLSSLSKTPIILVAEDNPDVRDYIVEKLEGDYRVIQARDGHEALKIALQSTPDIILTDLMMPGLDGVNLTRHLKSDVRTNHIPVVMLTAKSTLNDRIGGIETGAEAYLVKPFDATELKATLGTLLAQRRILQEKFSRQIRLDTPVENLVSLDDQFLQKLLQVIETNLDDDTFGVEPLASEMAMSRSNLFRKVEALTGKSPNQLIRERRLLRAKTLLEQGTGNSTEVAFMTGFNSPSYFAKCFSEMFGETPGLVSKRRMGNNN